MSNSRLLDRHFSNNICPDLKIGDRIILIQMFDPISPVSPGSRGIVKQLSNFMDETIYSVNWDDSGSLNLLSSIDILKKLDKQIERSDNESNIERLKNEIRTIEKNHDVWMFEDDYINRRKRKNILESKMKILITENKLENIIKSIGITRTINLFGGFDNYCKVFKIEGPMDFLKSLPLMDVVQSEEKPDWSLFRYEKGKNMMVYDRKIETVYINYNEIWSVLSNKFELNYSETEKLTKEWLDEVYNLREVTPNKSTSFSERSWMRYTI